MTRGLAPSIHRTARVLEDNRLSRDEIVSKLRAEQPYLATEFGVSKIGLFGSYARDHATENSDIDLVVEFDRSIGFRFFELAEYLERLLGHRVDLLTQAGIQSIRLRRVAQNIAESIVWQIVTTELPAVAVQLQSIDEDQSHAPSQAG